MLKKGIQVLDSHVLVLGFTFKEDCPDVRNIKVWDICRVLKEYNVNITVYDLWADPVTVMREYGISVVNSLPDIKTDAAVFSVAHSQFMNIDIQSLLKKHHVLFDVKGIVDRKVVDGRL